jgi:CAAX protease family protein
VTVSSTPPPLPDLPGLFEGVDPALLPEGDRIDPYEGAPLPSWPAWSAPVAIVAAFAVAIVGGVVVAIVAGATGADLEHPPPAVNIVATFVQDGAFIATALLFADHFGGLVPAQLGLRRARLRPALGWSAVTLFAFFVASGVWASLVNIHQKDELPSDLGVHQSTVALVAVCVLVTVVAPIAEELLFRGYVFGALRGWRGPWVAAVLTGIVFGAIHVASAPVVFLFPLGVLGFMLCLLRWRTGSLLPCMAVHAFNNSIAFGVNEASWSAGAVLALIVGAIATILLVLWPFLGPSAGSAPARA